MIEILSKNDINLTMGEAERALINQLRLYRNYNETITEVVGFVLPTTTAKWDPATLSFESFLTVLDDRDRFISRLIEVERAMAAIV